MYCLRTLFMSLWKVASALFNLKGIILNWYCPFLVKNAVFDLSFFLSWICQYAEARSITVNHFDPQKLDSISLIFGKGYLSGIVRLLRGRSLCIIYPFLPLLHPSFQQLLY